MAEWDNKWKGLIIWKFYTYFSAVVVNSHWNCSDLFYVYFLKHDEVSWKHAIVFMQLKL